MPIIGEIFYTGDVIIGKVSRLNNLEKERMGTTNSYEDKSEIYMGKNPIRVERVEILPGDDGVKRIACVKTRSYRSTYLGDKFATFGYVDNKNKMHFKTYLNNYTRIKKPFSEFSILYEKLWNILKNLMIALLRLL